jgi:phosphonate transport system ATP-binding protein
MLKIEHLSKTYPNGTQALKDVSFQVEEGEFLAVIGLSGSGKSTLLRCINRLIEPTAGKIIWNDVDVTAATGKEIRNIRRQIGMIFQQFNLVKRSSVKINVLSGRLGYVATLPSLFHVFSHEDNERVKKTSKWSGWKKKWRCVPILYPAGSSSAWVSPGR